jgi:hypothetical protein
MRRDMKVHQISPAISTDTASQFRAALDPRHRHVPPRESSIRYFRDAALSDLRRFFSLALFALARQRISDQGNNADN